MTEDMTSTTPSADTRKSRRDPTLSLLLTLVIAVMPAVGHAQTQAASPPATCSTAMNTALPAAWSAWTQAESLTAAPNAATQPEMALGHAYTVTLSPIASVQYPLALKKVTPGSFGGLFMLTIDKAGTYSVALDNGGWLDMVRDGQSLRSSAHGHGPDCSTIHKIVEFDLTPGHYTLQLSNADKDTATLEVVAK